MTRLRKSDVVQLLDTYDADPVTALSLALRRVLDLPAADWEQLLAAAPIAGHRRAALVAGEQRALDDLAAELNERRTLDGDGTRSTQPTVPTSG